VATAPTPVRNAELRAALRRALHRPPALPIPVPLVRLGALLLRTDPFPGAHRAVSTTLAESDFPDHSDLDGALAHLLLLRPATFALSGPLRDTVLRRPGRSDQLTGGQGWPP
jgi:NAD dependent epimerase/dehydratase family enzyme